MLSTAEKIKKLEATKDGLFDLIGEYTNSTITKQLETVKAVVNLNLQILYKKQENEPAEDLTKNLFKRIFGILVDTEFQNLSEEELVKISLGAVAQFAKNNNVKI
jgi:hypothetical protein